MDAGFDGVQLHDANGYPLHEILPPASNQRTDGYGGSPEARARFVMEVAEAVVAEVGAGRGGIRISPAHNIQEVWEKDDSETRATYEAVIEGLTPLGLAYLSVLLADLVAVGRSPIANPDLVTRWEQGADENEVDQPTVYGGGDERGSTDYPFLQT